MRRTLPAPSQNQPFEEAALIFCGGLTPEDFQTAFQRLEAQSRELETAREKLEAKISSDPAVTKAKADLSKVRLLGQQLDPEPVDANRELIADFHG